MRLLRITLTFYRSFVYTSSIITLACLSMVYMNNADVASTILLIKLVSFGLIILYINLFRKKEFYYYHNLGLTKTTLWLYTFGLDFLFFLGSITLILWLK